VSKRKKRLERLRCNPHNVSLEDLRRVFEDYGFVFRQTVGSHYTFTVVIGGVTKLLVIPFSRPVKSIYVKRALAMIDQIIAGQADTEEDSDESGDD
jgi:predicted RNA binding protein YcfA (HicA-like mRNA interferase family)